MICAKIMIEKMVHKIPRPEGLGNWETDLIFADGVCLFIKKAP